VQPLDALAVHGGYSKRVVIVDPADRYGLSRVVGLPCWAVKLVRATWDAVKMNDYL
jgi:hypothetical protein